MNQNQRAVLIKTKIVCQLYMLIIRISPERWSFPQVIDPFADLRSSKYRNKLRCINKNQSIEALLKTHSCVKFIGQNPL